MTETANTPAKLVYLANPNNPTGTWFGARELRAFLAQVPATALVVLDEAYHEYVGAADIPNCVELVASHPNLLVTRTFSKGYGLAGLRLGYAVAQPQAVRYAWSDNPEQANLANREGLPASPFRTDDWQ